MNVLRTVLSVPVLEQKSDFTDSFQLELNPPQPFKVSALRVRNSMKTFRIKSANPFQLQMDESGKPPYLEGYKEGPHSLISGKLEENINTRRYKSRGYFLDSLFSLIIFIYVSVTFLYMFYAFCWRDEHPEQNRMQV